VVAPNYWDVLGMISTKCFGILVEGEGVPIDRVIARDRLIGKTGKPYAKWSPIAEVHANLG
jgi:hypothetical protein